MKDLYGKKMIWRYTRASGYRRDLILLCSKVGIEYHCPHTLRHLHVAYLKKHARNFADMETIARNIGDTPAVAARYGQLDAGQITDVISSMFGMSDQEPSKDPESISTNEKPDMLLNMIGKLMKN